ncbi:MAG: PilZ domain-containing protein [Phycisphaerae bacterium]|nr:PilZ domain-containing protein [Phycisphaerae bacterium]
MLHFGHRDVSFRQDQRERRGASRCKIPAIAKLTLLPNGRDGQVRVYPKCPILDVSATGMGIKSYQKVAVGTTVALELFVGDTRLTSSGTVISCTGFPGCHRIGLMLNLA